MANRSRGESVWVNPTSLKQIDLWAKRTGRSRSWVIALAIGALTCLRKEESSTCDVSRQFVRGVWAKTTRTLVVLGTLTALLHATKGALP